MSTATLVQYEAAAITDRGRRRSSNEDAFGYSIEDGVYAVCDGMGGAAAGEIASSLAIDEVLRAFADRPADGIGDLEKAAGVAIEAANHAIYSRAQRNCRLSGMGTTLVGLLATVSRVLIFNVGDSRCYRLRQGEIEQLTLDHSLVEEQVRLGRMTRAEAERSPLRNIITRALGTQSSVTPEFFDVTVEPGDIFLLCSDGLTRELTDERIAILLDSEPNLDELCKLLVKAANKAGGHDNITCVVVRALNK